MDTAGFLYMLMWAATPSDMDVENFAHQVNGATSYEDCREMLTTYVTDNHMWCMPVEYNIKPLNLSQYK